MSNRLVEQTFYEILEVSPDATQQDIHTAYHRAKATYSPDSPALYSMFTREEARELMNLIEEAFSTLSNQSRRKDYDKQLIQQAGSHHSLPQANPARADDLPDFQPPEAGPPRAAPKMGRDVSAGPARMANPQKKESLPEGFGRTRFSVYEIDDTFEHEIKQRSQFDGTFLQKVRLYKHVNLDQMSEETRISRTYLSAVETNDYDALPAPVFVRGFIVQFARILGLDEKLVADSYMSILRNAKG
ncbi:MAG: helix-turn-helix domain-containing protein [Bdellovibrionaceae bacterium]|nr:helix-turn-helix domain-containing protein [Bdellovibrionales bacterium]MCB9085536.1 helix-turn-helix domain-containing protein [Pseudobdellovibrionaceae bacterium]